MKDAYITRRCPTNNQETVSTIAFSHILCLARQRDEEALMLLYRRAFPVIYRYVMARLEYPDLVEDVVAEVFLTMVEAIGDLRTEQEAGFYAWLLQIAHGKISKALRGLTYKKKQFLPLHTSPTIDNDFVAEPMATDLASDPVALHELRETLQEVEIALERLSTDQQLVVVGRFLAGQSIEDLSQSLGKLPGAVRALQFRALGTLAEHLGRVRGSRHKVKGGKA